MRFGELSYRTEGAKLEGTLCFLKFPQLWEWAINTVQGSFSKRYKCSECENSPFAKKVQCNESLLKGSMFMNAEAYILPKEYCWASQDVEKGWLVLFIISWTVFLWWREGHWTFKTDMERCLRLKTRWAAVHSRKQEGRQELTIIIAKSVVQHLMLMQHRCKIFTYFYIH